jgi:hypothetical protein
MGKIIGFGKVILFLSLSQKSFQKSKYLDFFELILVQNYIY